eukprot:g32946.t1
MIRGGKDDRDLLQVEPVQMQAKPAKSAEVLPQQVEAPLRQLHTRLEQLMEVAKVEGELEVKAAKALSATDVTQKQPQLDEAIAYEALVGRLRAELRWERASRHSCEQALETLRGSYGLLLSRVPSKC